MSDHHENPPLPSGLDDTLGEPSIASSQLSTYDPLHHDFQSGLDHHSTVTSPTLRPRKPLGSYRLLIFLVPYTLAATAGLIFLLYQLNLRRGQPHALEALSDQGLYEDFLDGKRREVAQPLTKASETPPNGLHIIQPTAPLPDSLKPLALGETRRFGHVAVTPLGITRQNLRYDFKSDRFNAPGDEALILKLQIKNESKWIFRPEDETFNRAYIDDNRVPVYTFLELGKHRFYGAVADPTQERLDLPRCPALLPDQTGEMLITAVRSADGKTRIADALKAAKELLLWRVQLRRGKEEVTMTNGRKRFVWVTTIVPIQFSPSDIGKSLLNDPE